MPFRLTPRRALVALALSLAAAPWPVFADAAPASVSKAAATPLVVIRFTQRNVYYEKALGEAVNSALETKKSTVFSVVLRPGFRSSGSGANLARVAASLKKLGVADTQVMSSTGKASGESWDEVDVFVH